MTHGPVATAKAGNPAGRHIELQMCVCVKKTRKEWQKYDSIVANKKIMTLIGSNNIIIPGYVYPSLTVLNFATEP